MINPCRPTIEPQRTCGEAIIQRSPRGSVDLYPCDDMAAAGGALANRTACIRIAGHTGECSDHPLARLK